MILKYAEINRMFILNLYFESEINHSTQGQNFGENPRIHSRKNSPK